MKMFVNLGSIAHGRSGDKGNHANIATIAYTQAGYNWLREYLTADRVAQYKVTRQRGTARSVRGARSERDARLDTLRALTCRIPCTAGRTDIASLPSRAVHGRPRLNSGSRNRLSATALAL